MVIRTFEAFAGYGSQLMALRRLEKQYPDFKVEPIGISEIDEYAIKAYHAVHGNVKNYGDISKIDWTQVPDFDLFTYSSPCQDFSSAGLQKGGEKGSGTRSSLLWECEKAISIKKPKYCLMENVAALVTDKFVGLFNKWQKTLEGYGYVSFAQVLNAKNYGVPQNRERIFLVSIRVDENEPEPRYFFPEPFPLKKRLKDVLEKNVDECYYLKDSVILDAFNKRNQVTDGIDVVGNLQPDNMWNGNVIRQQNFVLGTQGVSMAITSLHSNHAFKIKEDTEESDGFIDAYPIGRERTEEEKARRSKYGDKGAKFSGGKQLTILKDGVSGCVTTFATKDNLCAELYNETKTEDSE